MKICIPVIEDKALDSAVCAHFGSAPLFLIADTESLSCKTVINTNQHHSHGMCQPLAVLANEQFDGIVVGGIGAGALAKLQAANIKVFKTEYVSVQETLAAFRSEKLKEIDVQSACNHHNCGH